MYKKIAESKQRTYYVHSNGYFYSISKTQNKTPRKTKISKVKNTFRVQGSVFSYNLAL